MMDKEILGAIAAILSIAGSLAYALALWRKEVTPHFFTWVIWALICGIAFVAQVVEGAGPGSWVMGFTVISCSSFAVASLWIGEKNITRSDWAAFLTAMLALPIWYLTQNALWAVIIVSIIDALGFYPTFRKSWYTPWNESAVSFSLAAIKFAVSLFAIETFNWVTSLYPISLVLLNGGFVLLLLYRRQKVNKPVI
jgi:hypothetical protein